MTVLLNNFFLNETKLRIEQKYLCLIKCYQMSLFINQTTILVKTTTTVDFIKQVKNKNLVNLFVKLLKYKYKDL